jgi:phospholipase/carboxylesterase
MHDVEPEDQRSFLLFLPAAYDLLSGEVAAAAGRDALAVLTVAPKPDLGRQLSQENQDLDGAGDREGEGVVAARADPVAASRLAPAVGDLGPGPPSPGGGGPQDVPSAGHRWRLPTGQRNTAFSASGSSNEPEGTCRALRMLIVNEKVIFVVEPIGRAGVLWSAPETAQPGGNLLVLLHGATSNERDLFERLVPLLPENLIVASPRGRVQEGGGYSWISPEARASAVTDLQIAAVGNEIARAFLAWLDVLPPFESLGVLGGSQGACVAFQLLRAAPFRFDYAINLSGYSLPGSERGDLELQRSKPAVFWGRGIFDEVIPQDYIDRTRTWLVQHSTLIARTYEIGHGVSAAELGDVAAFVGAQISDAQENLPPRAPRPA